MGDCKLRSLNKTPVWEGWQFLSPAATFGTGAESLTPPADAWATEG
jgi:hypothetical protein